MLVLGIQKHWELMAVMCKKYAYQNQSQDGLGIGWGDHFLPHKFIKRSIECLATSTKQILNAGRGHQAPRKVAQSLQKEVG